MLPPVRPRTHYAKAGDISIAYQVTDDGPVDLVRVPGWISNVDYEWEYPPLVRLIERLSRFSRFIRFDKRGTGLSDREVGYPTLEERMEELCAVMDAAGSERAILFGSSEGGNMCILFYPQQRTSLAAGHRGRNVPEAVVDPSSDDTANLARRDACGGAVHSIINGRLQ